MIAASTLLATGNWKIALTIGVFVLAFNFGLMLGNAIKEKYGDSIDFFLKQANVNFSEGVNLKNIQGITKTLGNTFKLIIADSIRNATSLVFGDKNAPEWLNKALTLFVKNGFGIVLTAITQGIPGLISSLASFAAKKTKEYLPAMLIKAIKNVLEQVADKVKNIPYIGEAIANGITGATKGLDEMLKNSLVDDMDEAEKLVKPNAESNRKKYRRNFYRQIGRSNQFF